MTVPRPGAERSSNRPPMSSARSRMLVSPSPPPPAPAALTSNPTPSSATLSTVPRRAGWTPTWMRVRIAVTYRVMRRLVDDPRQRVLRVPVHCDPLYVEIDLHPEPRVKRVRDALEQSVQGVRIRRREHRDRGARLLKRAFGGGLQVRELRGVTVLDAQLLGEHANEGELLREPVIGWW